VAVGAVPGKYKDVIEVEIVAVGGVAENVRVI
jgi:hypothetical protein